MQLVIKNILAKLNELRTKKLGQDYFWGGFQIAFKQGGSFLIFLIGTYLLNKETMGMYNYYMGIVVMLVILVDLGISTATSRFVAEYAQTDKEKLKEIQFNVILLVLATATVTVSIILWQGPKILGEQFNNLVYFLPIVYFSSLASVLDGIYRGKREFKKLSLLTISAVVISIILTFFLVTQKGFLGLALAQNGLYALLFIFLLVGSLNGNSYRLNKSVLREVFGYSLTYSLATVGYYLFSNINTIMIGRFEYYRELAYYELLHKSLILPLLPFTLLGIVIAPIFTTEYAKKNFMEVFDGYKKYLRLMIIAGVMFFFGSLIFVPAFVYVLARQYFDPYLFYLMPPFLILYAQMALSAPLNSGIIVPTGHANIMTVLNLLIGGISAGISYLFIRNGDILASLYAMVTLHTIGLIALNILFYRRIKNIALNSK